MQRGFDDTQRREETRDERKETELCWFLVDTVHGHSPYIPIYDVREIIGKNQKKHMWETYYLSDTRLGYVGLGPRLTTRDDPQAPKTQRKKQ